MTTCRRDRVNAELRQLMGEVGGPDALTDDEAAAVVEILRFAWERQQEPIYPGVVYLDFGRRRS